MKHSQQIPPPFSRLLLSAKKFAALSLGLFSLFFLGCGTPMIPGTNLPATSNNKQIVHIIKQYRQALEGRNWRQILSLVSPRYHETGGTPTPSDDYGYNELRSYLTSPEFKKIRYVRVKIDIERIEYREKEKEARVYLRSRYSFRYPRDPYKPGWSTGVNDFMMVLEFHNGNWLILRGI